MTHSTWVYREIRCVFHGRLYVSEIEPTRSITRTRSYHDYHVNQHHWINQCSIIDILQLPQYHFCNWSILIIRFCVKCFQSIMKPQERKLTLSYPQLLFIIRSQLDTKYGSRQIFRSTIVVHFNVLNIFGFVNATYIKSWLRTEILTSKILIPFNNYVVDLTICFTNWFFQHV